LDQVAAPPIHARAGAIDIDRLVAEIRSDPERMAIAQAFATAEKLNYDELARRTRQSAETLRKTRGKWFSENGLLNMQSGRGGGLHATELLKSILPKLER
jgi:hypothetical protein